MSWALWGTIKSGVHGVHKSYHWIKLRPTVKIKANETFLQYCLLKSKYIYALDIMYTIPHIRTARNTICRIRL